jgi:hypothetical protein
MCGFVMVELASHTFYYKGVSMVTNTLMRKRNAHNWALCIELRYL